MRKHLHNRSQAGITASVTKSPRHRNSKDRAMFAKILLATLVLAGTSLTFVADASATTGQAGWQEVRSLSDYRVGGSPLCPPAHSYRECFYPG